MGIYTESCFVASYSWVRYVLDIENTLVPGARCAHPVGWRCKLHPRVQTPAFEILKAPPGFKF